MATSFGANQNNNQLVDALLNALTKPQNRTNVNTNSLSQGFASSGRENPIQDLRPIIAQGQAPAPTPSMMPPIMPIAEPTMPQISTNVEPQMDEYGQTRFGRLLSTLGIPLASTIAGLAIPGALPAATGFSEGYVPQMISERKEKAQGLVEKRKEAKESELVDAYVVDENGNYVKSGEKIAKNAIIRNKPSKSNMYDFLNNSISLPEVPQIGAGVKEAEKRTEKVKSESNKSSKVLVAAPNGAQGYIDSSELQEAQDNGYRLIQ